MFSLFQAFSPLRSFRSFRALGAWSPTGAALLLLSLALMTGCASPSAQSQANALADAPTLTSEEFGARLIPFIVGLRTVDDISPEALEKAFGIKVRHSAEDAREYGTWGDIGKGEWIYYMRSIPEKNEARARRILIQLSEKDPDSKPELESVCKPSFNDFDTAFQAAGYDTEAWGLHGIPDTWAFRRGLVSMTMTMHRFQNPIEKGDACVRSFDVFIKS